MRLALIYALLDSSSLIRPEHLRAGLAVWAYAEDSVARVFGDRIGDPVADQLLAALRNAGDVGLSRTQIRDFFGRNRSATDIERALGRARPAHGRLVRSAARPGRPRSRWLLPDDPDLDRRFARARSWSIHHDKNDRHDRIRQGRRAEPYDRNDRNSR